MDSSAATISTQRPKALPAILWGGFACGVLVITAALFVYGFFGLAPIPLLQGIATGLLGSRAPCNGIARSSLSLCHRVFGRCYLLCGEPRNALPHTARRPCRCFVRRRRLFFHESRRCAALRGQTPSVFSRDDAYRRSHTHLLCRATDLYRGPTVLN